MKTKIMLLTLLTLALISCGIEDDVETAIITISGNVSHDGRAVSGALVLLVASTSVADGLNLANASLSGDSGNYTILGAKAGLYYLLAVDDRNGNLEFNAGTDRLGFYGVDLNAQDLDPDRITVSDKDVANINVISFY